MQFDRAAELENPLLLGTVLADRYLGRFHRSTADELSDWLSRYSDLPDATVGPRFAAGQAAEPGQRTTGAGRRGSRPLREPDPVPEDIDPPRNHIGPRSDA